MILKFTEGDSCKCRSTARWSKAPSDAYTVQSEDGTHTHIQRQQQ